MNDFDKVIKDKPSEELLRILNREQDYQPEFIEAIKKELTENRQLSLDPLQQEQETSPKIVDYQEKIHGWLTAFLVAIGFGSAVSLIMGFIGMSISDADAGLGYFWALIGVVCDSIFYLGILCLAIYTIYSFCNYKPNAVGLGKAYLIIVFTFNVLAIILGNYEATGIYSLKQLITALVWQIIWFVYLSSSDQVKSLFPKKERKLFKRDKILLFSFVSPTIIWVILTFAIVSWQGLKIQKYVIDETQLSYNEYTDNWVIFEPPSGLLVDRQYTEDGDTFFELYDEGEVFFVTIYTFFDDNDTQEYFEECMLGWADPTLDYYDYSIKNTQYLTQAGNSAYLETWKYDVEPPLEWTFVMVFNKETGKCCVLSCHSLIETDYLPDLIKSIRFK